MMIFQLKFIKMIVLKRKDTRQTIQT